MFTPLTANDVAQVDRTLKQLKDQHAEKLLMKENLRKKSEEMETKLDRADKLVTGLAGERIRWENTVGVRNILHYAKHRQTGPKHIPKVTNERNVRNNYSD